MNDKLMLEADEIERKMLEQLGATYWAAMIPVLEKHQKTLDAIRKIADKGEDARVLTMLRTSGFLDDAAESIAMAGSHAAVIIRGGLRVIKEVARHEKNDD